jgi:hypothetical protein
MLEVFTLRSCLSLYGSLGSRNSIHSVVSSQSVMPLREAVEFPVCRRLKVI